MAETRHTVRRKPLWRWEPFGYIVLFVAIFVTSALQAAGASVAFVIFLGVTIVIALALAVQLIVAAVRGPGNPDAAGNLSTLAGLRIVRAGPAVRTELTAGNEPTVGDGQDPDSADTAVFDAKRHQSAIDAASAFGGPELTAVLVPGASRWLGMRLRVAVHLVATERVFHAGFLPPQNDAALNDLLDPLRERGVFVQVPARVIGQRRPFDAAVDLSDVQAALDIVNAQEASS